MVFWETIAVCFDNYNKHIHCVGKKAGFLDIISAAFVLIVVSQIIKLVMGVTS